MKIPTLMLSVFCCLFVACNRTHEPSAASFYYWRTVYELSILEQQAFGGYNHPSEGFDANSISYAWDGFKKLKGKYAHTQYYKDVIRECEYFEYYVNNEQ